jgi:hypothetical protein
MRTRIGQTKRRSAVTGALTAALLLATVGSSISGSAMAATAGGSAPAVQLLDQNWAPADRDAFYWTSQGSQIMPYAWMMALELPNSQTLFMADNLARYGYLAGHPSALNPKNLPVGFTSAKGWDGTDYIGMTCGACHTGQVEYNGTAVRLDGAPTDADFGAFLTDLTLTLTETARDPAKFDRFARRLFGSSYNASRKAKLSAMFNTFTTSFASFMTASLPKHDWGPARLDAFGMIFNRLTGLDLNVPANVLPATAPVSYPFMWNAHDQNKVQWNLSAPNGTDLTALARNTGEVIGVFARLDVCRDGQTAYGTACSQKPLKWVASKLLKDVIFYDGSVSLSGLLTLEDQIKKLKPPPWPSKVFGGIDGTLAAKGKPIFAEVCADCHHMSKAGNIPGQIWTVTPPTPINTDPTMYNNALRTAKTGILEGTANLGDDLKKFGSEAPAVEILTSAVAGAIVDGYVYPQPRGSKRIKLGPLIGQEVTTVVESDIIAALTKAIGETYAAKDETLNSDLPAYEARPLYGIWATAPFLHNGSVRTLWELLKPSDRPAKFYVKQRSFDPKAVGIANATEGWLYDTSVTGNSNKGHDTYNTRKDGTPLTDADLWAMIEYMKTLKSPADL